MFGALKKGKAPNLALILARSKPTKPPKPGTAPEDRLKVAKEAMAAMKADDAEGFAKALEAYVEMGKSGD